jgi:ABC-type antimicrobial peptide transport system permease subunit
MDSLFGRTFDRTAEQAGSDDVVVLSHGLWQRRFGSDRDIVGRTILLNERPFTVIGVMPRDFDFPIGTELWVPLTLTPQSLAARDGRHLFVAGRLRDGVSVEQANAEMNAIENALGRIMSSVLYGVVALEAGTFAGAGLLLAVSALIAGYIPARRASSIDPVTVLRDE